MDQRRIFLPPSRREHTAPDLERSPQSDLWQVTLRGYARNSTQEVDKRLQVRGRNASEAVRAAKHRVEGILIQPRLINIFTSYRADSNREEGTL